MPENSLTTRLVEIESMLDRSRRRFEEGSRLVEEAHKALADLQQALLGAPLSSKGSTGRKLSIAGDCRADRAKKV